MPVPTIRHLASGGVITNYHCDLCTEIRTFLRRRPEAEFPEIAPAGFYR